MNPVGVTEPPLMGNFYRQVVVLLLFATNGYLLMIEGFAHSFAGPGFSLESTRTIGTVVLVDLQVFFVSALEIGGPIMVVLFAAQVVLALVSRAAPQANVWFLGMPLQVLLVLVLVALAVAAVPGDLASLLDRGLGDAARLFGRP
jgi:flagellar biosynthetic protein FliR